MSRKCKFSPPPPPAPKPWTALELGIQAALVCLVILGMVCVAAMAAGYHITLGCPCPAQRYHSR